MRLDVYLSATRILKSRSLVKTAVDEGMVYLNSKRAKPASGIKVGDIIEVDILRFYRKIRVMAFPHKNMKRSEATNLYEPLEERKKELI
jgi:ribosome-associated heat shock protein Hsp15